METRGVHPVTPTTPADSPTSTTVGSPEPNEPSDTESADAKRARLDCLDTGKIQVRDGDRFRKRWLIGMCGDLVNNTRACVTLLIFLYIFLISIHQGVSIGELRRLLFSVRQARPFVDTSDPPSYSNRTEEED